MFTLYGDQISGNCLKVKYVADFLNLTYRWEDVSVLKGDAKTARFLALNPVGQFPIVQFSDGRCLSQSNAIMRFLAKDSELVPRDPWLAAKMDEWLFWEQYSHETAIAVIRFHVSFKGVPIEDRNPDLVVKGETALQLMEGHLQHSNWFVENNFSLADIALFAYTQYAPEGGFSLQDKPNICRWLSKVQNKLNITPAS